MAKKAGSKRKREEKTKTQLKRSKTAPGVHLPKGTNVTKTEFKVGKIVIPKQLAAPTDASSAAVEVGPLTKKKLGLRELLSKLGHFSQSVRFDSLEGLRELIVGPQGGSLVVEHLALLVSRLAPLTSDREGRVRRAAFAILQAVLSQVEEDKLEPLFPILTAHVSCCLTHIDPAIQQDGLSLIDSLVSAAPTFIASNYIKILPDCLEQISARRSGVGTGCSGASKPSSTVATVGVSAQLSERMTSLQWRVQVLARVDNILGAILAANSARWQNKNPVDHNTTTPYFRSVDYHDGLHCTLYATDGNNGQSQPLHMSLSSLASRSTVDVDPMLSIVDRILPLILESWVEATSTDGKQQNQRKAFVSNDVMTLLALVARILDKIVDYGQLRDDKENKFALVSHLADRYFTDLDARLFSRLPFSSAAGRCSIENILLARVALCLGVGGSKNRIDIQFTKKVLDMLTSMTAFSHSEERLCLLKTLLTNRTENLLECESQAVAVRMLVELSTSLKTGSAAKIAAVELLSRLAEEEEVQSVTDDRDVSALCTNVTNWLKTLPDVLLSSGSNSNEHTNLERVALLKTILKFVQRKHSGVTTSVTSKLASLIDWSQSLEEEPRMATNKMLTFIEKNLFSVSVT